LESYHAAEAFKLICNPKYNILENVSEQEYRLARKRIVDAILATDMANHSKHITHLNAKLDTLGIDKGNNLELLIGDNLNKNYENQQVVLNMLIHTADVSNPGKPLKVYQNWVELIFEEFFYQGDLEKSYNYPISMLCDRETTNIAKAQIGFINFVVKPTFESIIKIIPSIDFYLDNLQNNLKYYEDIVSEAENTKRKESKENVIKAN